MAAPVKMTAHELAAAGDAVERALREDLGPDLVDVTSAAVPRRQAAGVIVARADGVVCGLAVARLAFERLAALRAQRSDDQLIRETTDQASAGLLLDQVIDDGMPVQAGDIVATVQGDLPTLLSAERVALNFSQRLSGIATHTAAFVQAVAGTGTRILDTRKTTPGLRALERYAVRCGGGMNHRFGLFDAAMVKDNHIDGCGGIAPAVAAVRSAHPDVPLIIEARTLDEVRDAAREKPDVILLDNMTPDQLRAAIHELGGALVTEASGGITLDNVAAVARSGVDRISIGALTHSSRALDLALDLQ